VKSDSEDRLIDQFEDDIKTGTSPNIENVLALMPEDSKQRMLLELISIEVFHGVRKGRQVGNTSYARFGEEAVAHANRVREQFSKSKTIKGADSDALTSRSPVPKSAGNGNSTLLPFQTIGPYKLILQLGVGGMGTVWLAEQERPVKRRVALKLIRSELPSKEVLARFDAEKQALAMMAHPNIARVIDAGNTDDGRPYFVMELVDGIPITKYCDSNRLSIVERLKLFVPVCKAVQHAHQKGILHRDLKPSNVLVADIDGVPVPKVIDFGMAKAVQPDLQLTDQTMNTEFGSIVGTLQYMSPEQAELSSVDIDTRTDVYSLGVMLYELLSGSTPLDKETLGKNALLKTLQIIREKDPPKPSSRLGTSTGEATTKVTEVRKISLIRLQKILKGDLDWVVMKALEKDRTRRYQSVDDFSDDISSYLAGDAIRARPPSTGYQVRKFANRHRGLVAALLAIGITLLVGIIGTTYGLLQANQKTELAERKSREAWEERANAVEAEGRATVDSQRARDAEAAGKFQLAVARYDADRAVEARTLLHQIPQEYRDNFEWHYCNRRFQGSVITCYGHTSDVYEVAFTPDGERVVSAGKGGTIRLWDATTGEQLGTLAGHDGQVLGLAVSPEGSLIASAGFDKIVRLWDAESGEIIRTMTGHAGAIGGLAFSPGGDRIASASSDKTIKVWDTKTGEEVITVTGHTASVLGVAFSPDGKQLASTSSRDKTLRIWDSRTGEQIKVVHHSYPEVRRLAFSPEGTRLAAISYGSYLMWDTRTWELAGGMSAHNRIVRCVAFSPDGTQLATAGDSTEIKLWDARTGNLINTLRGHANTVWGVAFSHDGARLVSASADKTVRIWNTHGDNDLTLGGHSEHVHCVAFSLDGRQLASGAEAVILRDAQTGDAKFRLKGHMASVAEVSFSPNGTQLASAADDNTVRLWNTETGEEVAVLKGHTSLVTGVAYSPDGNRLVSSSRDGTIKLWNAQAHEETATLKGHGGVVYCVVFSPHGSCLASASSDNTVKLWDVETGNEIRTLVGHTALVRTVAFDQTGKRLVSGGYDSKIRVWDVASGKQIATAHGGGGAVFGVAFSPDGKRFAACGTDHSVQLFETFSGQEIMTLFPGKEGVESVTFSPDGTRLAAAVAGIGNIRIWDAPKTHETQILSGHSDTVTSVTFSLDGSRIYSESENEKMVWNVATRETLPDAMWAPPEVITHTCLDGRWFVTTEANNIVLVDLEYKHAPDEKARRKTKASFDSFWHQKQATATTTAQDWYAATFHFALLMKHDPGQAAFYDGLHSSFQKLASQFELEARDVDPHLATIVKDSLKLPRGDKMPEITAGEAQGINNATWQKVSSYFPATTPSSP
jgi:eukaryotic-like serine/threonine-protein kinase